MLFQHKHYDYRLEAELDPSGIQLNLPSPQLAVSEQMWLRLRLNRQQDQIFSYQLLLILPSLKLLPKSLRAASHFHVHKVYPVSDASIHPKQIEFCLKSILR